MASTSKDNFTVVAEDDELVCYINTLSDDEDYLENEDFEVLEDICEGDNFDSLSDSSGLVVREKKPVVLVKSEESDEDDDMSSDDEDDNNQPPEYIEITGNQDIPCTPKFSYIETPGPKHAPPPNSRPIVFFDLFFTLGLWNIFVQETNRYADQFLADHQNLSQTSRMKKWHPVTIIEMKAFVAVLLEMGITKRQTIFSYWSTNSRCIPWFSRMFSRNRFQLILKFFHLTDNRKLFPPGHENYDPCARFQPIVDHANRLFPHYYTPHQHLSVDRTLVGTKNHSQILQYLPNKPHHKWGIKFWMLCDSVVNYCLAFYCYRGAKSREDKDEIQKFGLSYVVVKKLLNIGNYFMKGFHVVVDNFFTSIQLAHELFKQCTFLTGTLRKNSKNIPHGLKEKFDAGEIKYYRSKELLFLGYRENKSLSNPVLMLSTKAVAESKTVSKVQHGMQKHSVRPEIVDIYNKYKGGIYASDMMVYSYLDERRSLKFWKKVVFSIIARMVLNTYIIYEESNLGMKMTRLQFISAIIETIELEWLTEKNSNFSYHINDLSAQGSGFGIRKLPERREKVCVVCSRKDGGRARRSRTVCIRCEKGLHGVCLSQHQC